MEAARRGLGGPRRRVRLGVVVPGDPAAHFRPGVRETRRHGVRLLRHPGRAHVLLRRLPGRRRQRVAARASERRCSGCCGSSRPSGCSRRSRPSRSPASGWPTRTTPNCSATSVPASVQDLEWGIVQVVVVAAIIVLLWNIRGAFPARLAPGTRRLAIGALVLGLLISIAVSITLTQIFPRTLTGQRQKIGWAVIAALGQSRSKMGGHEGHGWIGLTGRRDLGRLAGDRVLDLPPLGPPGPLPDPARGARGPAPAPAARRAGLARVLRHPPGQGGRLRPRQRRRDRVPGGQRGQPGQRRSAG